MLRWSWVFIFLLLITGCRAVAYQVQYVPNADVQNGRQLIIDYGCGTCHTIPNIPKANTWVGPPLTKWAHRSYIAGSLINNPDNLIVWLQNPQSVHPNSAMPNLDLSEQEARDISAYLFTLR